VTKSAINDTSAVNISAEAGAGLILRNPFIAASGTCGYGTEYSSITPPEQWGALVLKTVTPHPRKGNPPPRTCETDSGMLNSIGLANAGLEKFISEKLPAFTSHHPKAFAVASIAGESWEEFAALAGKVGACGGVKAIELNFSCPNIARGGIHFAADTLSAAEAVSECRKTTSLPIWVKISPAASDPVKIAAVAMEAGADAIVAGNTMPGMLIDIKKQKPLLGNITGGLSGPAIFPVSLRMAYIIAKSLPGIKLIGCGGIDCAEKAIQFILAGCSAVEVGTAVFRSPEILKDLEEGLLKWMGESGYTSLNDFIGKALKF
jgi:dihydroorotate dehydrogenase (NAD+) catalytic subunit